MSIVEDMFDAWFINDVFAIKPDTTAECLEIYLHPYHDLSYVVSYVSRIILEELNGRNSHFAPPYENETIDIHGVHKENYMVIRIKSQNPMILNAMKDELMRRRELPSYEHLPSSCQPIYTGPDI